MTEKEQKHSPNESNSKEHEQRHSLSEDIQTRHLYRIAETRTWYTLLALKGILLVAAIVLTSSSKEMSKAKPCDLEKVLVSLSVEYTSICKYDDIKKGSTNLYILGISFLVLNGIIFLLILNFLWIPKDKTFVVCIALVVNAVNAGVFSGLMIGFYTKVLDFKGRQTDTNYVQLKSSMITRLKESFSSDNVTSGDAISISWNKFFIENDCCAIHQVQGTTNDFDRTPWCTTSGSCQATSSQIPKTCCNYVTEDNYQSAPGTCHSSVNPGTYKSNCMIPIKKLSTINIEECQINLLLVTLLTIGTLEIAEVFIGGIWITVYVCCFIRNRNIIRICLQTKDIEKD